MLKKFFKKLLNKIYNSYKRYTIQKRFYTSDDIIEFIEICIQSLEELFIIKQNYPIYIFEKGNS